MQQWKLFLTSQRNINPGELFTLCYRKPAFEQPGPGRQQSKEYGISNEVSKANLHNNKI